MYIHLLHAKNNHNIALWAVKFYYQNHSCYAYIGIYMCTASDYYPQECMNHVLTNLWPQYSASYNYETVIKLIIIRFTTEENQANNNEY